jgi:hypothetical protein
LPATRIIWAGRPDHATSDPALVELAPLDQQVECFAGLLVTDWLLRRGRSEIYRSGGGSHGSPDYFLRLNLEPHGQLPDRRLEQGWPPNFWASVGMGRVVN